MDKKFDKNYFDEYFFNKNIFFYEIYFSLNHLKRMQKTVILI